MHERDGRRSECAVFRASEGPWPPSELASTDDAVVVLSRPRGRTKDALKLFNNKYDTLDSVSPRGLLNKRAKRLREVQRLAHRRVRATPALPDVGTEARLPQHAV